MVTPPGTSYDRVPYATYAHPLLHPERHAAIGTLFGMSPAPVERCRVLELGCGDGTNLIGQAYSLPESEFVGVDLSSTAIERGKSAVSALPLHNVTLLHADLLDFPPGLETFHYVIAHGVYSWVPESVRDRLLGICGEHLSPEGIAYVSYTTYPGGHVRQMIRDMLLFHVRALGDARQRLEQARALGGFLLAGAEADTRGGDLYRTTLERLLRKEDHAVFHDDLAAVHDPVYFHEFAAQAAEKGLKYLSDADLFTTSAHGLPKAVVETLESIPGSDAALVQQYLDFVKIGMFRRTLLCRHEVNLLRRMDAAKFGDLYLSGRIRCASDAPRLDAGSVEEFTGRSSMRLKSSDPLTKAVMLALGERWPERMKLAQWADVGRQRLSERAPLPQGVAAETEFLQTLLQACEVGLVDVHTLAPSFVVEATERPRASALARWMASHGDHVITLNHATIRFEDSTSRRLIQLCDGTRTVADLHAELQVSGCSELATPEVTEELVARNIEKMARLGLMEG